MLHKTLSTAILTCCIISQSLASQGTPDDLSYSLSEQQNASAYHLLEEEDGCVLMDTPITDEVVIALLKSNEIFDSLDLSGCNNITDALLPQITILRPNLKELYLDYCKGLTFKAIREFLNQMPDLELLRATPLVAGKSVREALSEIRKDWPVNINK